MIVTAKDLRLNRIRPKRNISSWSIHLFTILLCTKTNASSAPIALNIDQTTAAAVVGGNFLAKLDLFPTSTYHSPTVHTRANAHALIYITRAHDTNILYYIQCRRSYMFSVHALIAVDTKEKEPGPTQRDRVRVEKQKKKTNPLDKFCVHDTPYTTLVGKK